MVHQPWNRRTLQPKKYVVVEGRTALSRSEDLAVLMVHLTFYLPRLLVKWDVDRYQQQHSFVWEYGSSLIDLVLDGEDSEDAISLPSPRVLDVGCGSGELTAQLAKRGCRAVGMDADPAMVQRAREQFKLQEDVDFFQADVRDFSVSEPYDVLFSNAALHWVPPIDVDRAFGCLSHALKPGGKLVVEFGGQGNVETIVQAVRDCSAGRVESPWYFPSMGDVSTRLEAAGIEVTAALLYDRPTPLEAGPDGLANWLRMFGQAFWEQLPATTTVESVLADVSEKCRSQLWDGKQWKADYRRIRVVGRKL